jgi:ACS family hexuronate transporter-like MFS transporter
MTKWKIRHLRWYIAFLLCLASALNYLDRQSLAVLFGTIKKELHLGNAEYGTINAWFLVSYGIMYLVSGRVIDIVGTRRGFTIFVSGWSLANMLYMFARSVGQFCGCGFLLGCFEPGGIAGGVRVVSEWFPMRDRALAMGIINSGVAFGAMACAPLVSFIAMNFGLRAVFLVTGVIGFVWVVLWLLFFKQPKDHPQLSEEERQLILADQRTEAVSEQPAPLALLLRMKETWGCVLVRMLTDPISYFLLFWIPRYFQETHGFDLKELGMFTWIPFAVAAVGNIFGGAMPRWLISRGWELNRARKTIMTVMTCLFPLLCLLVTQVRHPAAAMAVLAGMAFCHASWANVTLVAEVFPKNAAGTVTGLGGTAGSLMGALSQLYIGRVAQALGFAPIFVACAVLYPLAMLVVQLLIGKLGVVRKVS